MCLICFKACVFIQTALQIWYVAKAIRWTRASFTDMLEQSSPERQHPGVGKKTIKKKRKQQSITKFLNLAKATYNPFSTHLLGYENMNVIPLQVISVYLDMTDKRRTTKALM